MSVQHNCQLLPQLPPAIQFDCAESDVMTIMTQVSSLQDSVSSGEIPSDGSKETKRKIKKELILEKPIKISSKDQADVVWNCRECKKTCFTEDTIRQHIITTHLLAQFDSIAPKGQKIYSCDRCFKYSTTARMNYIRHLGMQHQVPNQYLDFESN